MPDTIMKCERTDHWVKMRPSRARSSAQAASCHILSSVDFITSTFESEFLVHTRHALAAAIFALEQGDCRGRARRLNDPAAQDKSKRSSPPAQLASLGVAA